MKIKREMAFDGIIEGPRVCLCAVCAGYGETQRWLDQPLTRGLRSVLALRAWDSWWASESWNMPSGTSAFIWVAARDTFVPSFGFSDGLRIKQKQFFLSWADTSWADPCPSSPQVPHHSLVISSPAPSSHLPSCEITPSTAPELPPLPHLGLPHGPPATLFELIPTC